MSTPSPLVVTQPKPLADRPHPLWPYRAPNDFIAATHALTEAANGQLHTLGTSVEGRAIYGIELPSPQADAPSVLVCANIHGVEFIAAEVALGVLGAAAIPGSPVSTLRERANIWVIPSLNPDAYAKTRRAEGRGALDTLRKNANGVDLNRNFPRPDHLRPIWFNLGGWRTGSDEPGNAFFRGKAPLSEPESRTVAEFHERVDIYASANLHSTMGTIIPPCVRTKQAYGQYAHLANAFRAGQHRWRYRRLASRWFDRYTGEQEDFQHHQHNTWAVCIEHYPIWVKPWRFYPGSRLFWRFNPRDPTPWIANDVPGLMAFFEAALELERA